MAESKLDEYRDQAEELRVELDAQLPTDLLRDEPTIEGDVSEGAQHGPGGEPSSPASWHVRHHQGLVDAPGSSERAAQALHDYLVEDGWTYSRERGSDDDTAFAEGYRRGDDDSGEWYIEIIWAETTPERAETLRVLIVSPMTVLGTEPPEREWAGPIE